LRRQLILHQNGEGFQRQLDGKYRLGDDVVALLENILGTLPEISSAGDEDDGR
jgi:hypothetical protein